jgi:membrane associated rhomboid family serine protease
VFPYRDDNQTQRPALVTMGLIATCVLVWVLVQGAGAEESVARSVCNLGLVPGELTGTVPAGLAMPMTPDLVCVTDSGPQTSHILTHMFLHGSWMHLLGNMWFLWLFGNNVEDAMTRPRFLVFYLVCGLAAALLQIVTDPHAIVPMVGASGAISGVMGAYLVLYPRVRVYTLVPLGFFVQSFALPAWAMLLYWAFLQFAGGLTRLGAEGGGGVAFWAHVGGFLAGIVLVKLFVHSDHLAAHQAASWRPSPDGWG